MKDLKALMGKGDPEKDSMQKDAKLSVLKHLREMASGMMGDDVKDGMMKKVTVAAPDKEGLAKGLAKAKELVGDGEQPPGDHDMEALEEEEHQDLDNDDELGEDPEHVAKVLSPEEIDAKIAELQAMKHKMQKA